MLLGVIGRGLDDDVFDDDEMFIDDDEMKF